MLEPNSELPFFVFRERATAIHKTCCPDWFVRVSESGPTSSFRTPTYAAFYSPSPTFTGVEIQLGYKGEHVSVDLYGNLVRFLEGNIWQNAGYRIKGFCDWYRSVLERQQALNAELSEFLGHDDAPLKVDFKKLKPDWQARLDEDVACAQVVAAELTSEWVGLFDA